MSLKKVVKAKLVDVFSNKPLNGNGLTIFWNCGHLSTELMQKLTQEMRQFESIFVKKSEDGKSFRARIFTMEEELDFAGHPLIGLGAHLHEEYGTKKIEEWNIKINSKEVYLKSHTSGDYYTVEMHQGKSSYIKTLSSK